MTILNAPIAPPVTGGQTVTTTDGNSIPTTLLPGGVSYRLFFSAAARYFFAETAVPVAWAATMPATPGTPQTVEVMLPTGGYLHVARMTAGGADVTMYVSQIA